VSTSTFVPAMVRTMMMMMMMMTYLVIQMKSADGVGQLSEVHLEQGGHRVDVLKWRAIVGVRSNTSNKDEFILSGSFQNVDD
jgi:hypothetical protein